MFHGFHRMPKVPQMGTSSRSTLKLAAICMGITRHKWLQWGPGIITTGLFIIMGRPLRFFHQRLVVWKREQNVPQMSQHRGSTLKVKTPRAKMRGEAKNHSLTGGLVEPKPLALIVHMCSSVLCGMQLQTHVRLEGSHRNGSTCPGRAEATSCSGTRGRNSISSMRESKHKCIYWGCYNL